MLQKFVSLYKSRSTRVKYAAALLLVFALIAVFFASRDEARNVADVSIPYRILNSKAELKEMRLKISGVANSKRIMKLFCEASGKVEAIIAQRGALLRKGEVILTIAAKNKQELYDASKAALHQNEIKVKTATGLYQKKLMSESEYMSAKARFSEVQAAFKQAELDLQNTKLVAPFDGYLENLIVNEADYLTPSNSVGTFIASSPMVIIGEAADSKVRLLHQGQEAVIESRNGDRVPGHVSAVGKVINEVTSSFPIEIKIDNRDFQFLHGQAVSLSVVVQKHLAHKIPKSALILHEDGTLGVKCLDEKNTVRFFDVQVIDEDPANLWVKGLPEESQVVTLGQANLEIGTVLNSSE